MKAARILLAAGASGSGKTLITCGLLQALVNRGLKTASFKCGPDYIDPMFHSRVIGAKSRNLDTFFTDSETTKYLFCENAVDCDISVMEGVMGFYDGVAGTTTKASAYDLASVTDTPVILIVNSRGMSVSLAAYVKGFMEYRKDSHIQGVIFNQMSPMLYPRMKELLEKERYVIAAEYEEDTGKYASLTDEKLEELRELCDVMLVEADGARHHPVKVPEKWEPVIPRCADIVISVIGLDCLGQPISQSAYRMERTSEFLRKSLEAPITEEDIVKIATSICGLFKDVEERVYRVYLNKSDILREKEPAEHIVEELERKNTVAAYGSLLEE